MEYVTLTVLLVVTKLISHLKTSTTDLQGGLLVSDALNHSSIVAGSRGSGAKVKVFQHNSTTFLLCSCAEL